MHCHGVQRLQTEGTKIPTCTANPTFIPSQIQEQGNETFPPFIIYKLLHSQNLFKGGDSNPNFSAACMTQRIQVDDTEV
jgi:hypothetical protein